MKKKYAQKYAQIQKQIRFLPLLLIALLVLSGVFGTWYVKADDANDPEWRLEAELLSDAGAVIGNEEAYAGKVIIRLRIFLSDERDKKENDLDKGGAEADGNIEETERSKETEEPGRFRKSKRDRRFRKSKRAGIFRNSQGNRGCRRSGWHRKSISIQGRVAFVGGLCTRRKAFETDTEFIGITIGIGVEASSSGIRGRRKSG